jgi:hypothetical protein
MQRQRIYRTPSHGNINVYAIQVYPAVTRGDRFFAHPVFYGKIGRNKKNLEKAAKIFCRLNWRYISGCHDLVYDDRLIISCQGYTFDLELVENSIMDMPV